LIISFHAFAFLHRVPYIRFLCTKMFVKTTIKGSRDSVKEK